MGLVTDDPQPGHRRVGDQERVDDPRHRPRRRPSSDVVRDLHDLVGTLEASSRRPIIDRSASHRSDVVRVRCRVQHDHGRPRWDRRSPPTNQVVVQPPVDPLLPIIPVDRPFRGIGHDLEG